MFAFLLLILALVPAAAICAPEDDFVLAAMRLAEAPNYRWRTTVNDNARTYVVEGRVLADGYTWMRLPMVESIALRLPPTSAEEIEALFRGPDRCAVQTPWGWRMLRELPSRDEAWSKHHSRPYVRLFNAGNLVTRNGQRPYSNAQFGLNCPHQELAIIVSCYRNLTFDGTQASGVLSNIGAQLLLVRDGQERIKPVIAAGRFTLWLGNGRVEKYLLELEGILLVDGQPCLVNQTASTVVADVGRTTLAIPPAVLRELEH